MCGFTFSASLLLFPVGLLALPIPVVVATSLATRGRPWPDVLGAALGASAFLACVAYWNRDSVPCGASPVSVELSPGQEFRCGGPAPEPWLMAALVVLAVASVAYAYTLLTERQRKR